MDPKQQAAPVWKVCGTFSRQGPLHLLPLAQWAGCLSLGYPQLSGGHGSVPGTPSPTPSRAICPSALLWTVLSALACSQQRRHQLLASELLGKTEMYEIQCGGHPSAPERGPRVCHGGRELGEAGVSQDSLLAKCILSSELTPRPRSTAPGEG